MAAQNAGAAPLVEVLAEGALGPRGRGVARLHVFAPGQQYVHRSRAAARARIACRGTNLREQSEPAAVDSGGPVYTRGPHCHFSSPRSRLYRASL
jgi:hypothetical protein